MIPKQFRIHAVLIFACAVMILFPLLSERPDSEKAEAATAAAEQFLEMIDAGQYDRSWEVASAPLREKVNRKEWSENLSKARTKVGPIVEREQEKAVYSTMAQDQPEGEFIVLTYTASFKNVQGVTETVTVMLDGSNWRVAGYFIQ